MYVLVGWKKPVARNHMHTSVLSHINILVRMCVTLMHYYVFCSLCCCHAVDTIKSDLCHIILNWFEIKKVAATIKGQPPRKKLAVLCVPPAAMHSRRYIYTHVKAYPISKSCLFHKYLDISWPTEFRKERVVRKNNNYEILAVLFLSTITAINIVAKNLKNIIYKVIFLLFFLSISPFLCMYANSSIAQVLSSIPPSFGL